MPLITKKRFAFLGTILALLLFWRKKKGASDSTV
jgi:hypothetical protein